MLFGVHFTSGMVGWSIYLCDDTGSTGVYFFFQIRQFLGIIGVTTNRYRLLAGLLVDFLGVRRSECG